MKETRRCPFCNEEHEYVEWQGWAFLMCPLAPEGNLYYVNAHSLEKPS